MSDLRKKLIKAGADAIHSYEDGPRTTRNLSTAVLDAFLNCLAQNKPPDLSMTVDEIVALLKESDDE